MDKKLRDAFRWHLQNPRRVVTSHSLAFPNGTRALDALTLGRADVAAGKARYPAPVRQIYRKSESDGLRYVGRVVPDARRSEIWDSPRGNTRWHTDPYGEVFKDGSGLCFGVVYQLPGRKGESRFVAGYEFGGVDGGPTLDLSAIFIEPRGDYSANSHDLDAATDAARHADHLAKAAAESEREYQTAWAAGSRWAQEAETVATARKEALELLTERKKAMRGAEMDSGYAQEVPAICRMIRREVLGLVETIRTARETMRELAAGEYDELNFWPGEDRLQVSFCEGAGLSDYPKGVDQ